MRTAYLCLAAAFSTCANAADLNKIRTSGTFKIGFATQTPDFLSSSNTEVTGFAVELMDLIAKEMKVKNVTWRKAATPEGLLKDLRVGTHDAIIDVNLPQPITEVDLTTALACTGGVMLSRPGGPKTEEELKGRSVAVATGSSYFYYVRNLPFEKKINVFANADQALLAFLSGSIDVLILDRLEALKMYKRAGPAVLQVSPVLWSQYLSLHVTRQNNKEVTAAVNVALRKLMNNGAYEKLSKKFFTQDVRCVL